MKKYIALLLFASIFVCGCSTITSADLKLKSGSQGDSAFTYNPSHYPVFIKNVDSQGRPESISYTHPPGRIVAIWQNSIETPIALGVGERIIAGMGVPDKKYLKKEYQAQYDKIPYKSLENMDVETILMLQPEIIIGWYSTFSDKVLRGTDFWHKRGIHTYISPSSVPGKSPKLLEDEYQDILNLGKIFDKNERAKELVNNMKTEIELVAEYSKKTGKKSKGLVIEFMGKNIRSYGSTTLVGDIFRKLNGEHMGADASDISIEQIIEMDPDAMFLVITESNYDNGEKEIQRICDNKALRNLRCVKNKRMYLLPLYTVYSSGIRSLDGIQIIARGLYPELYKERQNAEGF